MLASSPSPKIPFHPLEVLTRRGMSQAEIAKRLGITAGEVVKVRRQLHHLNWTIVAAAYEVVRLDGKPDIHHDYTLQIRDAVARKLALPGGRVEV
jgi:transcriptional regulator with XRE-family HTH domain